MPSSGERVTALASWFCKFVLCLARQPQCASCVIPGCLFLHVSFLIAALFACPSLPTSARSAASGIPGCFVCARPTYSLQHVCLLRPSHFLCSAASGIPGCVFVHASGFIGGNDTLEGAVAMAAKALDME